MSDKPQKEESQHGATITVLVKPEGRRYTFSVNGLSFQFIVPVRNQEFGLHPLDLLQNDLNFIVQVIMKLERFSTDSSPEERKFTLDDIIPPKVEGKD